jgi:hypothetical protein
MPHTIPDPKPARTARFAGLLYLLFIATSILASVFGRIGLGTPAEALGAMTAQPGLFRIGFVCGVLSALLFLVAAWALQVLLRPVNAGLALLFLLLNAAGVAVQVLSMLGLAAGLELQGSAGWLDAIPAGQRPALALLSISLYKSGFVLAQIFYGSWVLPLGYLFFASRLIPRPLGVLLMLDCPAILLWFLQHFLLPGRDGLVWPCYALSALAEFSLTFWLLVRGVKSPASAGPGTPAAPAAVPDIPQNTPPDTPFG